MKLILFFSCSEMYPQEYYTGASFLFIALVSFFLTFFSGCSQNNTPTIQSSDHVSYSEDLDPSFVTIYKTNVPAFGSVSQLGTEDSEPTTTVKIQLLNTTNSSFRSHPFPNLQGVTTRDQSMKSCSVKRC
jgi:hypothetical protein